MPYCTACGATVRTADAFCPECGTKRHDPGSESAATPPDERVERTATETAESAREPVAEASDETDPFERRRLSFALSYPARDGYEPFLLGSIFALVGSVVPLLALFTYGYTFRVTGAAADGRTDPPEFDDFLGLFVDGLRATVALLVLGGVTVAVGASVAAVAEQVGLAGGVRALAVALVAFGGLYLTPAVLTAYAATRRFPRAFSSRYAGAFATSTRYLEAFAAWVLMLFGAAVLWLVSILTLVGPAFVSTYAGYVCGAFWGYQYREAADAGVVPAVDRAADEETAADETDVPPTARPP